MPWTGILAAVANGAAFAAAAVVVMLVIVDADTPVPGAQDDW
ncbi:hypothetical protein VTH06DRAFT_7811 [Thermothelomyces fergusii]